MFTSGCIFDLMYFRKKTMFKTKNSTAGSSNFRSIETDVLSLMKRNKLEEKQQKRKNILFTTAGVSALLISGLLISL